MKIINRYTIGNGVGQEIHCEMEDGSKWRYARGAEEVWCELEPSTEFLENSFNKK